MNASRDEHQTRLLMIQKNSMPFRNIENVQLEIREKFRLHADKGFFR